METMKLLGRRIGEVGGALLLGGILTWMFARAL
jgi:hypothetical protein